MYYLKKYLILVIIIVTFLIPFNSFAEDSLSITRWIVFSELMENGDLQVSEDITFNFNDGFNGVYRDIVLEGTDGISNLVLSEMINGVEVPYVFDKAANKGDSNVYSYEQDINKMNLMIFSPADNEKKTFRIKYNLLNVAIMHSDTGEFYYKYLGDENETPIDYFSATLLLPRLDPGNVKIFAHGPLNGNINFIDNDLIKLDVSDVPTRTFVEARVLFPNSYTPLSTNTGNKNLSSILEEETSFIRELEEKAKAREATKGILNNISIGLLALGTIITGYIFKFTKRDPNIYENMNSLYPKDISPAELNLFMNQTINSRGLMASIFDLGRREYLTIDSLNNDESIINKKNLKKQDFIFERSNKADADLIEHERYLLDWLFNDIGDGHRVTTLEIDTSRSKKMMGFNKSNSAWYKLVNEQLKTRGYTDTKSKKLGIIVFLISMLISTLGLITIIFGGLYGIAAILVGIFLFVYSIIILTRKSDEGFIQYGLWKDFIKEFENYKNLDINIPKDKTLIYAVALGISMQKLDNHRRIYGTDYFPMYWGFWYFQSINNKGGSTFEDRFNNSFYGATGTSNPNSTSFGGGGGFSGGGGGGAGGGGAGGF